MIRRRYGHGAGVAIAALVAGCAPSARPALSSAQPAVPAGMQYLYGSGEAAAISRQAYAALADYVRQQKAIAFRQAGARRSVMLDPAATLAAPRFGACGSRPLAIVLDVDETALLNTGYEYAEAASGRPYDAARWARWERTGGHALAAVPGAVEALAAVRAIGLTVVFNSNRSAANAAQSERALAAAGLGPARPGETLFLKGEAPGASAKDPRRALIGERYCVVAMVGDQLGDFSDLFNAGLGPTRRRAAADAPPFAELWGHGWFMLPNPVYGTGLAGGFDEVFPAHRRWVDPGDVP